MNHYFRRPVLLMRPLVCAALVIILALGTTFGQDPAAPGRRLMFFEYGRTPNRFIELDAQGNITWEFKPPSIAVIFQPLANGNLLYAYGGSWPSPNHPEAPIKPTGVIEIDRAGKTVWEYVSKCPQVLSCERLPNRNTLVGEQAPCQVVEVSPQGKVVHITPMKSGDPIYHRQLRNIQMLPNGNILAGHEYDGAVREYDPSGKVVWEFSDADNCCGAIRLEDGNTLIACGTTGRVIIVTPEKKIVWEFGPKDAPELNLTTIYSLQVLKNGNFLIGNFIRGREGKGAHAFEVTRDKKVVWTFSDHKRFKSIMTVRAVDE